MSVYTPEAPADQARLERHQEFLRQGIEAARAQDSAGARIFLRHALTLRDDQEAAWLWLASVAENQSEVYYCMERIARINPDNHRAREWLCQARSLGLPPPDQASVPAAVARQPLTCPPETSEEEEEKAERHDTRPIPLDWAESEEACAEFAADETVFLGNAVDLSGEA